MADVSYEHYGDAKKHQKQFSPVQVMRKIIKQIQLYRSNSRAIAQLRNLDNRMLSDMGITRSEIVSRVWNKEGS